MSKGSLFSRIGVLFLSLSLALPAPVFGLRQVEPVQSSGTEELLTRFLRGSLADKVSVPAAGAEEGYPFLQSQTLGIQVILGGTEGMLKDQMRGHEKAPSLKMPDGQTPWEDVFVVPSKTYDIETGTSYVELEFEAYFKAFILKNIWANPPRPMRIVGTQQQVNTIREYLRLTIFGPDWERGDHGWLYSTPGGERLRQFFINVQNFFSPQKDGEPVTIGDYIELIPFDEKTGVAIVPIERSPTGEKGNLVIQRVQEEGKWIYQVSEQVGSNPSPVSLGTLPDHYRPPRPPVLEPTKEQQAQFQKARFGFSRTVFGSSTGFDSDPKEGNTTSMMLNLRGIPVTVDSNAGTLDFMEGIGVAPQELNYVLLTHVHQDHDGGILRMILQGKEVKLIAPTIVYEMLMEKISLLLGFHNLSLDPRSLVTHIPLDPGGKPFVLPLPTGEKAVFESWWNLHTIPAIGFSVTVKDDRGRKVASYAHSGDTYWSIPFIDELIRQGVLTREEGEEQRYRLINPEGRLKYDYVDHEAGGYGQGYEKGKPLPNDGNIHTLPKNLAGIPHLFVYHVPAATIQRFNDTVSDDRKLNRLTLFQTDDFLPKETQGVRAGAKREYQLSLLESNALVHARLFNQNGERDESFLKDLTEAIGEKSELIQARPERASPLTVLFKQGDPVQPQDKVYFILSGKAGVYSSEAPDKPEAILGPGDHVGDWEVATKQSRIATVVAETDLEVFSLSIKDYERLFLSGEKGKQVTERIQWVQKNIRPIASFLRKLTGDQIPPGLADFCCSLFALSQDLFFRNGHFGSTAEYKPGTELLSAGTLGDEFYVLRKGKVEVVTENGSVVTLGEGEIFGEIGALMGIPRTAAVRVPNGQEGNTEVQVLPGAFLRGLADRFPRLRILLWKMAEERIQTLSPERRVELFRIAVESEEQRIAREAVDRKIKQALQEDARQFLGLENGKALAAKLAELMGTRGNESLDRLEREGREQGKDYKALRRDRKIAIRRGSRAIVGVFNEIIRAPEFQGDPGKQRRQQAAALLMSLFHLLLVQDEADVSLPFVGHDIGHSVGVWTNGKMVMEAMQEEVKEALEKAYPDAADRGLARVLVEIALLYHDIGYGLLTQAEERAAYFGRVLRIPGYKTGKGYHTRLGVVLANTPILDVGGKEKTSMDLLDELFGLSGMKGHAAGSRNALQDFEIMIERHGADKGVQEDLPGTGKHAYTPVSFDRDILDAIVRIADNLDVDAKGRLKLHQNNPIFIAFLLKLTEAANGKDLKDSEARMKQAIANIKRSFDEYADVWTRAYQLHLMAGEQGSSREEALESARNSIAILRANLGAFDETNFPHFAGMVRSHHVTTRPGPNGRRQLVIQLELQDDNDLIPRRFLTFQVERMEQAFKSIRIDGSPIHVEVVSSRKSAQQARPVELSPTAAAKIKNLEELANKSPQGKPGFQRILLDELVKYLKAVPDKAELITEERVDTLTRLFVAGEKVGSLDNQWVYVLVDGNAEAIDPSGQQRFPIRPGDFIGDMAILYGQRTATVEVQPGSRLLALPAAFFADLLEGQRFVIAFTDSVIARSAGHAQPPRVVKEETASAAGAEEEGLVADVQRYINRIANQVDVLWKNGVFPLSGEALGADARSPDWSGVGGVLIRLDEAKIPLISGVLFGPDHLYRDQPEALEMLPWVPVSGDLQEFVSDLKVGEARRGRDLGLFDAEQLESPDLLRRALSDRFGAGKEAQVLVLTKEQLGGLTLQSIGYILSREDLPPVIVLVVAARLQDSAGNLYALVLWA